MIILAITTIAFLGALFCWHWQDSQRRPLALIALLALGDHLDPTNLTSPLTFRSTGRCEVHEEWQISLRGGEVVAKLHADGGCTLYADDGGARQPPGRNVCEMLCWMGAR